MALDIGKKEENEGKNSRGRLSAEEFNRLVEAVVALEKMTLGGLSNVLKSVDDSDTGSLLTKGNAGWDSVSPLLSELTDYENMLMPVYHKVSGRWVFISVSSIAGGITPPVLGMVLDNGVLDRDILG